MGKILLIEEFCGEVIGEYKEPLYENKNESVTKDDVYRLYVECILQKANVKNRNGRIYPKNVLGKEATRFQTVINDKAAFNELDHPDNPSVSLRRDAVSHMINKMWWDGDTLMGVLEIITSPGYVDHGGLYCAGDHVANMLKRGYKLGISSRGLGSLKNIGGQNYVQDDFELICFDIVSSPSTPNAYLYFNEAVPLKESTTSRKNTTDKSKLIKFLNK